MKKYKVKVYKDRTVWCNSEDQIHREDGPAIEYTNGDKYWYINGDAHREDGPAIEREGACTAWLMNGLFHREDGPAVEYGDGEKHWYINGRLHREDGPASEYAEGNKYWYINGKALTESQFNQRINSYEDTVVEIYGKKYKLTQV